MKRRVWGCGLAVLGVVALALPAAAGLSDRYAIDVYKPDKAYAGTTIFGDNTDPRRPVIVEVDMTGKVVWSYNVPPSLGADGGMDVEWIPSSDHILFTRKSGVYEVDRSGRIVWSNEAPSSHDADRLPNGNTLVVWGWGDDSTDPEVREVDPSGKVVWAWHAAQHLKGEHRILDKEGYTHTNAAIRLDNGDTLISLRNFYMLVEVDRSGNIVWKLPGLYTTPHDPEILANGDILVNTRGPQVINEITPSGRVVWRYVPDQSKVQTIRYTHQLPNGDILFAERTKIIEITRAGEIVWQLRLKDVSWSTSDVHRWLYKAERIPASRRPEGVHPFVAPSETLARTGEAPPPTHNLARRRARQMVEGLMRRMDADGDGRVSRSEFHGRAPFDSLDANGDGFITPEEAEAFFVERLNHPPTERSGGR